MKNPIIMTNSPVELLLKNIELLLKKSRKDMQPSCFENAEPFDGFFEVTDSDGHTRKVSISPKSTMRDLEKMIEEVESSTRQGMD